jgi:predicted nucleic acid-binding protein
MLVDTSVWVQHLRYANAHLAAQLDADQVKTHPFVIGELACGHLTNRAELLNLLAELPVVPVADHDEVFSFVESRRLMGRGLGWIDMHLLASATLAPTTFWTTDKRLATVARELGLTLDDRP